MSQATLLLRALDGWFLLHRSDICIEKLPYSCVGAYTHIDSPRPSPPTNTLDPSATMVNQGAQSAVQASLDSVTGDASTGIAGLVFVAVDKSGNEICANASGNKGLNGRGPMDTDTVFWIASCTKLLAAMACMQAVEQGKLRLDDAKQVGELCPELKAVKVLQEGGKLVEKEREITLRMLLSHTAGFGYEL